MFLDARTIDDGAVLTADVVVLGAGAAGITLAHEFVGHDATVLLVEAGGLDYDDATQQLYDTVDDNPVYPDGLFSRLRYFGGSTNHWAGVNGRLQPLDFERQPWSPHSGWPIDATELESAYGRAGPYVGVDPADFDVERVAARAGFPLPPFDPDVLETRLGLVSGPVRFGELYGSALERADNVRVLLWANAVELASDAAGRRLERVKLMTLDGRTLHVAAALVVVALGGIESARLLLVSRGHGGNGLGNDHDVVGRYFMDHPVAAGMVLLPNPRSNFELFERNRELAVAPFVQLAPAARRRHGLTGLRMPLVPVTRYYIADGIESFHLLGEDVEDGRFPDDLWRHLGNILVDLDMMTEAVSRQLWDRRLFETADDFALYLFDTMIEQAPRPENRITLADEVDALGYPRARISWRLSDEDTARVWRGYTVAAQEFARAGVGRGKLLQDRAERIWGDQLSFGHHHMGTLRMGDDPRTSVVDRDTRVHGVDNLYVASSAVFTTGGHVQPTLTIVALAIRLADRLKARLRG
jgi:choline dehydrogenase-like flavoprotein